MKLYATVTSERGKEIGKGGNEYIEMELKAGDRNTPIGYIILEYKHGTTLNGWVLTWKGYYSEPELIAQGHIQN